MSFWRLVQNASTPLSSCCYPRVSGKAAKFEVLETKQTKKGGKKFRVQVIIGSMYLASLMLYCIDVNVQFCLL